MNARFESFLKRWHPRGWLALGFAVVAVSCGPNGRSTPDYSVHEKEAWRLYAQKNENDPRAARAILENIDKAIRLAPDRVCVESYVLRGKCWARAGEKEKALRDWEEAIRRAPTNRNVAEAYCGRAISWGDRKENQKALNDANQAISLSSNYVLAYMTRAMAHKELGMYGEAHDDMRIAIDLMPDCTNFIDYDAFAEEVEQGLKSGSNAR